jgi:hypothetical protein
MHLSFGVSKMARDYLYLYDDHTRVAKALPWHDALTREFGRRDFRFLSINRLLAEQCLNKGELLLALGMAYISWSYQLILIHLDRDETSLT